MGGFQIAERPSLDRLKALDSLSDVSSQVAEANKLCTHGARADMLAKWSLEKIRTSSEHRTHHGVWDLLLFAFRLLSPERLAGRLGSLRFFDAVEATINGEQLTLPLLESIADAVEFLFEASASASGTAIKAALTVPAAKAAMLLGRWVDALLEASLSEPSDLSEAGPLLSPILKLWECRKQSAGEDLLIAEHVLVPAASLLTLLPNQSNAVQIKRKRPPDQDEHSNTTIRYKLEALLAKHIILSARNAFFEASSSSQNHKGSSSASKHRRSTIPEMLVTLKHSITAKRQNQSRLLDTLPRLLDIAIRSVATPAFRQQTKERPWIEAVFKALHACNMTVEGELISEQVFNDMLQTIGERSLLSEELLMNLILSHAKLADDDAKAKDVHIRWELIAQIVELNPGLFCEPSVAEKLFRSFTEASAELRQQTNQGSALPGTKRDLWLNRILTPVMNAFARNRDFETFLRFWRLNLVHDRQNTQWSVWSHLDNHVADIVSDALTESEIASLVEDLSCEICIALEAVVQPPALKTIPNADTPSRKTTMLEKVIADIGPSIIILSAILKGLTSESLLARITHMCEGLFEDLLNTLATLETTDSRQTFCVGHASKIWMLLLNLFELWFPLWAARGPEIASITEKLLKWHENLRGIAEIAQALGASIHSAENDKHSAQALSDAECFFARMDALFAAYKQYLPQDHQSWRDQQFVGLVDHRRLAINSEASLKYSLILEEYIGDAAVEGLVQTYCDAVRRTSGSDAGVKHSIQALYALGAAAVDSTDATVIEQFVDYTVGLLDGSVQHAPGDVNCAIYLEHALIDVLTSTLCESLTRDQRERLLDAMSPAWPLKEGAASRSGHRHLALMVRLMERPNATANISTDPDMIWQLAVNALDACSRAGIPIPHARATISLIVELSRLIIKHLLTTQDQERSRSVLKSYSEYVKRMLEPSCDIPDFLDDLASLATFALSKSIMESLEHGLKPELALKLPHRNAETMYKILDSSVNALQGLLQNLTHPTTAWVADDATTILAVDLITDMLNEAMRVYAAMSGPGLEDIAEEVVTTISESTHIDDPEDIILSYFTPSLLRCYATASKYVSSEQSENLTDATIRVLDNQISPSDIDILTDSYTDHLRTLNAGSRVKLLQLHANADIGSLESHLLLLQRCISVVSKEDFISVMDGQPFTLLPCLLDAASTSQNLLVHQRVTACIITILKDKPFLTNQYNIELTLRAIPQLLDERVGLPIRFLNACRILSTLLSSHRTRLHGRFHLVIPVFQKLISVLFQDAKIQQRQQSPSKPLNHTHAHALSRILVLFCEPLNLHSHSKSSELVDESRKEQAYVGQYVQHVLHHYCAQVLLGTLGEGMKDALTPGIWAVIDAIRSGGENGMKSLSASMNNNERAILRGVYEDWRRFGKWRGG